MAGVVWDNGWRWIFILVSFSCLSQPCGIFPRLTTEPQEGIATVVVAVAAYGFVHNYPETAGFLSDKERSFILQRLAADSDATRDERFTWANVNKALLDPKCWLYGFSFHAMSLPLYTFSLFLVCN